jgi:twitching motility protein PilT
MSRIDSFLELAVKQGGSDLHLVSGQPPRIRINGILHRVRFRELSVEDLESILDEFLDGGHRERLERDHHVDFAYSVADLGRFRVNVYRHQHGLGAALRIIPTKIPTLESLGLPPAIKLHTSHPKGLILVTGPTGSGKSTTLAAMLDHINSTRQGHIITLEDPIEFLHPYKKCVVTQREIQVHAASLADALRDAVREDPDVLLVGEMRDPEAISLALTAAETGIQILGSLHTSSAARTIDRIVNVFPARRQEQVRGMLADSLSMIVSQKLLRNSDGSKRIVAAEILVNNHAVKTIVRGGNSHKLESVMQAGARFGMQSLGGVLRDLVSKGAVTAEEAYENATDKSPFENLVPRLETA